MYKKAISTFLQQNMRFAGINLKQETIYYKSYDVHNRFKV